MTYVSDHAVLRYLERVKGVDIEAVRRELMTPAVEKAIEIGCDTVKRGDGSRLKLVGDVVSTVLPPKGVDRHHRYHGARRG